MSQSKPDLPVVREAAVAIPEGETRYTVDLDEATVESLANGICPEELSQRMFQNLSWRREASRQQASAKGPSEINADLLAALKDVCAGWITHSAEDMQARWKRAEAAIAKAEHS